jgi:AraC-like DNA-binding protein
MSCSAFASRFRVLVGDTPLAHLTQWRMVRATSMLREHRPVTLGAPPPSDMRPSVPWKVFRQVLGVSPGKYRQEHQHDPQLL